MLYDRNALMLYCAENKIQLRNAYDDSTRRYTEIKGNCKTPDCNKFFDKTFRQLVQIGGFCEECSKQIGMAKNTNANIEKQREILRAYCRDNEIQLLHTYEDSLNRDTEIEGKCKTANCEAAFRKPLRQLLRIGGFCSVCSKNNGKIKITNTNVDRFGCANAMQNKSISEKVSKTTQDRYGVAHISQLDTIKLQKKAKSIAKYGVDYVLQSPIIRKQIIDTNLARYGVKNPSQNEEIRNRTKATTLTKYGVACIFTLDEFKEKSKQTSIRKYGVGHHLQNADYAEKHMKATYQTKQFMMPSGKSICYQGYENFGLNELLHIENVDEDDITTNRNEVPEIWYIDKTGERRRHYVDIFIKSQNRCIEIKSTWTNQAKNNVIEKQMAAIESGYRYDLWVYDKNGKRLL